MRSLRWLLLLVALGLVTGSTACDADKREIPDAWSSISLDEAPQIIELRRHHPAPADLPASLHLGQSHDAAMQVIKSNCPNTVRLDSKMPGADAYFVGCQLPAPGTRGDDIDLPESLKSLRVGFWPRIDRRVATLEVKRTHADPAVVWRRFRQALPDDADIIQARWTGQILSAATESYRLHADWDEGSDGPTHLVIGFDPDYRPQ
jgi:hypothetical protein